MEPALIALLLDDAAVAAQVGARVNWNVFPQGVASPAVRLTRISGGPTYRLDGPNRLEGVQVQVDIRATAAPGNDAGGFGVAHAAATVIKRKLSGFRGTHGGARFHGIFITAERHYDEKSGSELFHVISLDLDVWSNPVG